MFKKLYILSLLAISCIIFSACVDQKQAQSNSSSTSPPRAIATSVAITQIFDLLEVDLVGVCNSKLFTLPKRYDTAKKIGMPMAPDMEVMKALKPTMVFSPSSLQSYLEPQYKEINLPYTFLNMSSVGGLYDSMDIIAKMYTKEDISKKLRLEYDNLISTYQEKMSKRKKPKVLVLMGLPGSFVIATNKSYVGNIVELAGGENLFRSDTEEFLPVNTEELVKLNPDIILRSAHAMPDEVMEQFKEEFKTNDIWKHFLAVKNNKVYDLDYKYFGMSATMGYKEALKSLDKIYDSL